MKRAAGLFLAALAAVGASSAQGAVIASGGCSAAAVQAALDAASPGDTVTIPAGNCAWSNGISVAKPILLQGAGKDATLVTWTGGGEAIRIESSDALVRGFSVTSSGGSGSLVYVSESASSWRLTGMRLSGGSAFTGYFLYIPFMNNTSRTFGLIDHNDIVNMRGEQAFFRGPCNSWTTDNSLGGAANLFIEDNVISATGGSAYWDFNANARAVIRHNVVTNVYFDGHGTWSNSDLCPAEKHRGVRHLEVYDNTWTAASDFRIVNPRGGGGVVFGNRITGSVAPKSGAMVFLDEYCARSADPGWCLKPCAAPGEGPLKDQIGRGKDLVASPGNGPGQQTSEPMLVWDNLYNDGTRIWMVPLDDTGFPNGCGNGGLGEFIVKDRDYCLGTGPESRTKPASCNGAPVPYAPYPYPHPLQAAGGDPTPPAAPKGLGVQ